METTLKIKQKFYLILKHLKKLFSELPLIFHFIFQTRKQKKSGNVENATRFFKYKLDSFS